MDAVELAPFEGDTGCHEVSRLRQVTLVQTFDRAE
jgi:hypothetical protein